MSGQGQDMIIVPLSQFGLNYSNITSLLSGEMKIKVLIQVSLISNFKLSKKSFFLQVEFKCM